jgi:hypothetical protein
VLLKTVLTSSVMTAGFLAASLAGSAAMAQGIFTCVDAKGRKITSDRPIMDCIDRTQQEITPSGTVKRVLGPTLTAQERAALEEKEKADAEARALQAEEKRRDRALLSRYPNRQAHDKERAQALVQVDEVIKAATKRAVELAEQRAAINTELEFYKKDPSKAPPPLKRRIEENDSSVAVQKRFIADQDTEKKRVNLRFDEELVKLKQLWTLMGVPVSPAAVASSAKMAPKKL